jgi:uncharacterized protein YndB with AHSA1/START domain
MNAFGTVVGDGVVRFERVLPGPIETVWEYLVDSEKRGLWLARGEMERRVGGKVELFWKHSELSTVIETIPEKYKALENGGGFTGKVLAYEPPRLLTITWWDSGSEVTFELTPQGNDVLLVLTHAKLPNRGQMQNVSGGWHTHLGILEDRLNGREPGGFWASLEKVQDIYAERLSAN